MAGTYQLLIEKLDRFIRKFYINQLIRGLLYSIGLVAFCFLLFALAEHFFYFSKGVRKVLFFSFIGITGLALVQWVFLPLSRYFRLGKVISHEKAADIIGVHFEDVQDKLLNVLQLKRQSDNSPQQSLLLASIEQKTSEISPVPFQSAIDLRKNKKYLPYALPPLLILLGLLVGAPSLIKDSTSRIIKNNKDFERAAPFHFSLSNASLDVPQYEDFRLDVNVDGDVFPDQAFIDIKGFQYRMKKEGPNSYSYLFNNVQENQNFHFVAEGVSSNAFELNVLRKPNIVDLTTELDYPAYTGRRDETMENVGDMVVPQGTKIDWILQAIHTDDLDFILGSQESTEADRIGEENFTYTSRIYRNTPYTIRVGNATLPNADSVSYTIAVVPDVHPSLSVKQFIDSSDVALIYSVGDGSDDYGLTRLTFNYRITNEGKNKTDLVTQELTKPASKRINFDHVFDINTLELVPGDEVSYYYEIFDNDGVNGVKSTKSSIMSFNKPTVEEFEEKEDKNEDDIKKTLKAASKESEKIKNEFKSMREKMLQEKSVDWQMKKELEDLLSRQESLEDELEKAKQKFEENLENQQEFDQVSEETLEKQEKLQEMFEELADDETKELMEKIRELMEELKKEEALNMLEDMEISEDQLKMELDRLEELFEQLEFERDLKQQLEKLQELAKKELELSEESKKSEENTEQENQEIKEEQEKINEEFEEIKEEMEDLKERNDELPQPNEIEDPEEGMDEIQEDLDNAMEQMEQQQQQDAGESQQEAGEKMEQMAQDMQQQMEQSDMEQMEEDMAAMRQLLENLVALSFDQEDLIADLNKTNMSTPRYVDLVQDQYKLKDDFGLIEDSLQALSQRVFEIESFVLEKTAEVKTHLNDGIELLEDRKKGDASNHQQRTMKNVNDLALMFSESMDEMQQKMSGMMSGSQMCTKPGNSKGKGQKPSDKISEGQKSLNDQMKQMKEGMKEGKGSSKQFAQMAAKQAALRKALRDLQNAKQQQGKGGSKQLEEILEQMNNIETDLVNKKLTNEMIKRQEEILTRLLENEKAEREQEFEEKRESKSAENLERKLPPEVEAYIKEREAQIDPFRTVSPALRPYYKALVEQYYNSLKGN